MTYTVIYNELLYQEFFLTFPCRQHVQKKNVCHFILGDNLFLSESFMLNIGLIQCYLHIILFLLAHLAIGYVSFCHG